MHLFLNFFLEGGGMKLYMFRTVPLSIQQIFTVHTAMVYVIQLASRIRTELQFRPDPAGKL